MQSARAAGGPILDRLCRDGALDPGKLAALLGSNILLRDDGGTDEPAVADSLPIGSMIGQDYQVLDTRRGGFGLVYFCKVVGGERLAGGDRRVALKTLLPERLRDPADRALFQTEAARWISLGAHPNLVLAYGVAEYQRLPCIVMEFIEGARTLQDEICAGRVTWKQVLPIGVGVARALAHAQGVAGLVHGDIKPLNILLTPAGAAKLTDFGMSVCVQDSAAREHAGMIAGTPGYFAPEMLAGRPERTTATDIYAFGVTLFYAATGRYPFDPEILGANLRQPPPDPRAVEPAIPVALSTFILRCLDRNPAARGDGFASLAGQLERLHSDLLHSPPAEDARPDVPSQPDALVNSAQSLLHLGELRPARESATQAVAQDPKNWKAHNILGLVLMEEKNFPGALASFSLAHSLAPKAIEPLANAALANSYRGSPEEAARWLKIALEICSEENRFAPLDACSQLFLELMPEKDAYNLIHRILAENPNAAVTWNNRAVLMRRMGAPEKALESADQAIALNPVYAKAWTNRANALVELGRYEDAISAANRSIESDPTVAGAWTAKASALAQLGRLPEARACLADGLRMLPGNALLQRANEKFSR